MGSVGKTVTNTNPQGPDGQIGVGILLRLQHLIRGLDILTSLFFVVAQRKYDVYCYWIITNELLHCVCKPSLKLSANETY